MRRSDLRTFLIEFCCSSLPDMVAFSTDPVTAGTLTLAPRELIYITYIRLLPPAMPISPAQEEMKCSTCIASTEFATDLGAIRARQ